ncbi:unnamed protein product, partial [Polarella glacialis]
AASMAPLPLPSDARPGRDGAGIGRPPAGEAAAPRGGSPAQSSISSLRLRPSPLAVSYPSPMMLLNYPLVVTNVEMLCNQ